MSRYLLCNKPLNVLCSRRNDAVNPKKPSTRVTIYDHMTSLGYDVEHLSLVGRLDVDTSGVILFTDDTELMDSILRPPRTNSTTSSVSPRFKQKEYRLVLLGRPSHGLSAAPPEHLARIEHELAEPLQYCQSSTAPACVRVTQGPFKDPAFSNAANDKLGWCIEVQVIINEGKYHQVRRMAKRSGFIVVSLERRCLAGMLSIDSVPQGGARELRAVEVVQLRAGLGLALAVHARS